MSLFLLLWWGYIFRKINWEILSGFFPLVFRISLAVVKTDAKNVLLNSLFFQNWPAFFYLSHICLLRANWVLILKKKHVHCIPWVYAHYPKEQSKQKKMLSSRNYIYQNFFRAHIANSSFISCCFTSVFTSTDIFFYSFLDLDSKLFKN